MYNFEHNGQPKIMPRHQLIDNDAPSKDNIKRIMHMHMDRHTEKRFGLDSKRSKYLGISKSFKYLHNKN